MAYSEVSNIKPWYFSFVYVQGALWAFGELPSGSIADLLLKGRVRGAANALPKVLRQSLWAKSVGPCCTWLLSRFFISLFSPLMDQDGLWVPVSGLVWGGFVCVRGKKLSPLSLPQPRGEVAAGTAAAPRRLLTQGRWHQAASAPLGSPWAPLPWRLTGPAAGCWSVPWAVGRVVCLCASWDSSITSNWCMPAET